MLKRLFVHFCYLAAMAFMIAVTVYVRIDSREQIQESVSQKDKHSELGAGHVQTQDTAMGQLKNTKLPAAGAISQVLNSPEIQRLLGSRAPALDTHSFQDLELRNFATEQASQKSEPRKPRMPPKVHTNPFASQ